MRATYTERHDRLTLNITVGTANMRVTASRSAMRVSATPNVPQDVMRLLFNAVKNPVESYGERFKKLQRLAERAPSFEALGAAVKADKKLVSVPAR